MFVETPVFPVTISAGASGGPEFKTTVVVTRSGYEARNVDWSKARRRYDAAIGARSISAVEDLIAFFHNMQGRAHGFRYKDWSDYKSCDITATVAPSDQTIGTGDGVDLTFQLVKVYTSGSNTHSRTITKPVSGTVRVEVNGVEQVSGWTCNTATGVVTFTVAPTTGHIVKAGFEFDVPCRFDTDYLDVEMLAEQVGGVSVPIVEIRI